MHELTLVFRFSGPLAQAIEGALRPEAATDLPGSESAVAREEGTLRITLRAETLPTLRAAANGHVRWVDAAERAARAAL